LTFDNVFKKKIQFGQILLSVWLANTVILHFFFNRDLIVSINRKEGESVMIWVSQMAISQKVNP
jgi:hypothetical protein